MAIQNGGKWSIQEASPTPATGGSDSLGATVIAAHAAAAAMQGAQTAYQASLSTYFTLGGFLLDAINPVGNPDLLCVFGKNSETVST